MEVKCSKLQWSGGNAQLFEINPEPTGPLVKVMPDWAIMVESLKMRAGGPDIVCIRFTKAIDQINFPVSLAAILAVSIRGSIIAVYSESEENYVIVSTGKVETQMRVGDIIPGINFALPT